MNIETTKPSPLTVASASGPSKVAGAIAGTIRDRGFCEVRAIGAGAVNVAVKAIAISRGFLAPAGVDLICTPCFNDITIEGEVRTAIKFLIEPRR